MTVREFINSFNEEELDKDLWFNYSLTYTVKPTNNHWNAKQFNDIYFDETGEEKYLPEIINKNDRVIVELDN